MYYICNTYQAVCDILADRISVLNTVLRKPWKNVHSHDDPGHHENPYKTNGKSMILMFHVQDLASIC